MTTKKLIYLACPYKHEDPEVMQQRFEAVTKAAVELMAEGYLVFSPITHSHPMASRFNLPGGWDFWKEFDTAFLVTCDELHILKLDGWEDSHGIAQETQMAKEWHMKVVYREV